MLLLLGGAPCGQQTSPGRPNNGAGESGANTKICRKYPSKLLFSNLGMNVSAYNTHKPDKMSVPSRDKRAFFRLPGTEKVEMDLAGAEYFIVLHSKSGIESGDVQSHISEIERQLHSRHRKKSLQLI